MMPYKHLNKKMPPELDRRRKLTDEDKEDIKARHRAGESIRSIARSYANKCSRRAVQYTIRPETYEHLKKCHKERRADGRYKHHFTGPKWAKQMRGHRHYKQSIRDKLI